MTRRRGLETALLLLTTACLFFGGGFGCDPELDGTDLRAATFGDLRYAGFYGKKPPGNGWAALSYPIVPTASIEANVGVFNTRYLQASEDAEGCLGLRQSDFSFDWRICVTYQLGPTNLHIASTLSGVTADCPMATGAFLRLVDDGVNVSASYQCPGGSLTLLEDVPSEWDAGEKWFHVFGGYNLGKGAEVGFHRLRYASDGPFEASIDGNIAWANFEALRLGIDAYHEFDDDDFSGGYSLALLARSELIFATTETRNQGAFPGTDVEKRLSKADKTYFKLVDKLFPDKFTGYFKTFPKVAEEEACALDEEEDFF